MTKGHIISILSNLIDIKVDGPVVQNEICYVHHGTHPLRAEVIRIIEGIASAQVFEPTSGIAIGTEVNFTGKMLEVSLGPGLLSKNYDGLQNDLGKMESLFLMPGEITPPLDAEKLYHFHPTAVLGDRVQAGSWIGWVRENQIDHKIMIPFLFEGVGRINWIAPEEHYSVTQVIAKVINEQGKEYEVKMMQQWPVKKAIKAYQAKLRPFSIMQTGLRVIDTFNPIAEGGTGFIPGAFGTGKTVLQQAIAKNGDVDIVIVVACGERANEVVEIFTEFPELIDHRTGRKLYERTTIICNTSNMPVASREASVYVGMTIAEYYRAMGLKVLLLADSTSRWAQALREMSNRLEELPGDDAFPVDLSALIAAFYSRAGIVNLYNGKRGSITFIGTLSPAGGNFKEPVTESTGKVANCYYALSQARADAKRYPAIDSLASYSRYLEYDEFIDHADQSIQAGWVQKVSKAKDTLRKGIMAGEQINILGDDAVPLSYHVDYWKGELIDFVIVQQDSFDDVDMNCPMNRQQYMLNKVLDITQLDFEFEKSDEIRSYFQQLINALKQLNFLHFESKPFEKQLKKLDQLIAEKTTTQTV